MSGNPEAGVTVQAAEQVARQVITFFDGQGKNPVAAQYMRDVLLEREIYPSPEAYLSELVEELEGMLYLHGMPKELSSAVLSLIAKD